jgi:hypothetical protein
MSDQKILKVNAETFALYNQVKIRLAGGINRIPTTNEVIRALSITGERHYDDLVTALTERETAP